MVEATDEVVVSACTGRTLDVEETVLVQSSHALPLSDGQDQELKAVDVDVVCAVLVVAASTGRLLEVVETVETVRVQSSQALPLSEGHE